MDKLLDFGRKALFYVRVLSGYEERRIRNYRLQIEAHLRKANERKEALRRIPEQTVLAEVRRMVEEMQTVNRRLEEIEADIDEYFKPIDKEAKILMKIQLEGEEKSMKEMMKTMQTQALLEKAEAEKISNALHEDNNRHKEDPESTTQQHAQMK